MAKPAQILTRAIRDYLGMTGWLSWKNQSGGFRVEDRYIAGQQAGLPDLMAVKNGRLLCIEVKAGRDRLTDHQTAWLANAQAHGAIVIVAHSVDEVIAALDKKATP